MRKDTDDFYEDVYQLENFGIVDFLVYFVLSDVISNVKESHKFYLKFFVFQTKLHLHSLHRVRFHHELNIFLEVIFYDFYFHCFFLVYNFFAGLSFWPFFLFYFSIFWRLLLSVFLGVFCNSLLLFCKANFLYLLFGWQFFREISFGCTDGSDEFDVEILA